MEDVHAHATVGGRFGSCPRNAPTDSSGATGPSLRQILGLPSRLRHWQKTPRAALERARDGASLSFASVSAGGEHTCGVKEDGTVACWGRNFDGNATPPEGRFASDQRRG